MAGHVETRTEEGKYCIIRFDNLPPLPSAQVTSTQPVNGIGFEQLKTEEENLQHQDADCFHVIFCCDNETKRFYCKFLFFI